MTDEEKRALQKVAADASALVDHMNDGDAVQDALPYRDALRASLDALRSLPPGSKDR